MSRVPFRGRLSDIVGLIASAAYYSAWVAIIGLILSVVWVAVSP